MALATFLATTLGKIVLGVVALVAAGGAALGGLYLSDYGFEATIVDTSCSPIGSSIVTVQPKILPIRVDQALPFEQCGVISEGNFVIYNLRSERVRVYVEEGGQLLWDSATGPAGGGSGGGGPTRGILWSDPGA